MTLEWILNEKKEKSTQIKSSYGFYKDYKPLGLIKLSNVELIKSLINWFENLSAWFVIVWDPMIIKSDAKNIIIRKSINNEQLSWFDFILSDDNLENITLYSSKWITPIILKDNHLWNILKEFNPMKSEWNSFLYDEDNEWCIFYSLVRYLENYKFPFDNKNLVKNVLNI